MRDGSKPYKWKPDPLHAIEKDPPTSASLAQFIDLIPGERRETGRRADMPTKVRIDAIIAVRDTPNRRACLIECFGAAEEFVSMETADAFLARLKKENAK